jgi:hypothetical protein
VEGTGALSGPITRGENGSGALSEPVTRGENGTGALSEPIVAGEWDWGPERANSRGERDWGPELANNKGENGTGALSEPIWRREQPYISCCTCIILFPLGLLFALKMEIAAPAKTLVTVYYSASNHTPEDSNEENNVYYENHTKIYSALWGLSAIFNVMVGDTYNNEGASKTYIYKHFSSLRCVLYGPST